MKFLFGLTLCVTLAAALPLSSFLGKRAEAGDVNPNNGVDFGDQASQSDISQAGAALEASLQESESEVEDLVFRNKRTRKNESGGIITGEDDGNGGKKVLTGLGKRDSSTKEKLAEGMTLRRSRTSADSSMNTIHNAK